MRSSRRRYPRSTRTSYSVLGARKMHVILNRPESAERHLCNSGQGADLTGLVHHPD